jgi:signal transduction histidine kinase
VRLRPTARPWTLRRRLGISFVALGGVLTALVGVVVVSSVAFVSAGNRVVYRWEPAVSTTERLLTDLVEQLVSVRSYALSRDAPSLSDYAHFRSLERTDAARLRALIGIDRALRAPLADFEASAARWRAKVADPAVREIAAGDPRGVQLVRSAFTRQMFEPVRTEAAELAALVGKRADAARSERRSAGVVFIVAISLTGLIVVAMAAAVWRGLHRWVLDPVDKLVEQTRQVAHGDTYRQIVPSGPAELAGLGRHVEAMRLQIAGQLARAEEIRAELQVRSAELARSNEDLQQFAYVASHDLSEPLRKVANFCQLLERQYGDQLDERAREYIFFAVDGAKRMQALIADLLALSRVGRTTAEFLPVPLEAALDAALATLADEIAESGARIERTSPLPTVDGDRSLLVSLMGNLVGNAVKYRREGVAPIVQIWAEHDETNHCWTVVVRDNGIGIDPQYAERIFAVFQRLHLRDSYGGTGIGLALCRRIVEFHGGRIWLDPVESSSGATFRFTLPEGASIAESRD